MAKSKNTISFEVKATATGFDIVKKKQKGLADSIDKTDKSTRNLDKSQKQNYGRQKQGLIQTANGTKNFSKLSQTIGGGSSGLVGAYATLAANVFAASAAFNALASASKFQQLKEGLELIGNQSGRTLSVLSNSIREVTGNAVSMEAAMRGAALGISGGFGGEELIKLAKIAKGASTALGRDMGDAFDRLTRGAIKLEPEILDELGIMVRLDDAVETYAASLGKAGGALSQVERRQAFMNAILIQGEAKFGDIADSVDPSPYDRLGASFSDLTKDIFTFVNETVGLNHVITLLSSNSLVLGGTLLAFGSTIAGQMIPALGNAGQAAQQLAQKTTDIADAADDAASVTKGALQNQMQNYEGLGKAATQYNLAVKDGTDNLAGAKSALKGVNQQQGYLTRTTTGAGKAMSTAQAKQFASLEAYKIQLAEVIALEQGRSTANIAAANARASANAAAGTADAVTAFGGGAATFGATMTSISASSAAFGKELTDIALKAKEGDAPLGAMQKLMIKNKVATQKFGAQLRVLGTSLLGLMLPLAIVLVSAGLLFALFQRAYNTKEVKKFNKGQKELSEILKNQQEYAKEYAKLNDSAIPIAQRQIRQFEIISNSISEANEKLKEQIKLRIKANDSRPKGKGIKEGLSDGQAANRTRDLLTDTKGKRTITSTNTSSGRGGAQTSTKTETFVDADKPFNTFVEELGALMSQADFNDLGATAGTALSNNIREAFKINESTEFTTFQGLLASEVPEQADRLRKALDFAGTIKENGKVTKEDFANAIEAVDLQTRFLDDAFKSVNQTLKDAEKNAGSFIRALAPKTSADAVSLSFQSITQEMDFAFAQAGKAGKSGIEEIGRALTATGPNVARLVGPDFQKNLAAVKASERELLAIRTGTAQLLDGETKAQAEERINALLDKQLVILGGNQKAVKIAFKTIMAIQVAELNRNKILKQQKAITTAISKFQNVGAKTAKTTIGLTKLEFKLKKEQMKASHDILDTQFSNLKVMGKEGKLTEENISLQDFKLMALEDQQRVTMENGIELTNLNAINAAGEDERLRQMEAGIALANEANQLVVMQNTALLEQEKIRKKMLDMTAEGLKNQATIDNFSTSGATSLGRDEAAQLDITAAEKRLTGLDAEKLLREQIINAEAAIQTTRAQLLSAEIILQNEKTEAANKAAKLLDPNAAQTALIDFDLTSVNAATEENRKAQVGALTQEFENIKGGLKLAVIKGIEEGIASAADGSLQGAETVGEAIASPAGDKGTAVSTGEFFALAQTQVNSFKEGLLELGPEGAAIGAVSQGAVTVASALSTIGDANASAGKKMDAAKQVFSAIGAVMATQAKAQVASVDQQINAEKKRDGKSKESLAKIKAMEAKKVAIQRKAFEQNKKVQLANAIITGFSAIQSGFNTPPFFPVGLAMGAIAIAQTAAQIQGIRKQTFQGGGGESPSAAAAPSSIAVGGKRSNKVDVSKSAGSSEMDYLRGGKGIGSNANNFRGAAMGLKGYAAGGVVVGERGPEVYDPSNQEIIPNYDLGGGKNMNVTFNVNAVDAQSVEALLNNNQGAVVGAIRNAANSYGQDFLPDVNVGYEMTEK